MDIVDDADTVIGLDVRGKIFYCNKSKLLNTNNGNSYFSARFRDDSMLDAGLDRVDNDGRDVYKLDRDPSIFQHIIEYINTGTKPKGIGLYETNKKLWGLVREEALYFGLDHLVQLMKITFSCSPQVDEGLGASGKGIMHWLGTNKGTTKYVNPYTRGVVDILRWDNKGRDGYINEETRELMVQYRPNPEGQGCVTCGDKSELRAIFSGTFCNIHDMIGCSASDSDCAGESIEFHLLNGLAVCPTHYSIRNGSCYGMAGDWNFEASLDGKTWDVLHESRGISPLYLNHGMLNIVHSNLWEAIKNRHKGDRKMVVCDYMEENRRHTWKVVNTSGKFYTHFRFLSIEVPYEELDDDEDYRETCLHGIGFEVYGSVYEEWGDEKTRIEQLENQNEEVLNENKKLKTQNELLSNEVDSLKARVMQLEKKKSAEEACLSEDR